MAILDDVPFFAALDRRLRERLEEQLVEREFAAGEIVFRRGDPGLGLYVVLAGELAILGAADRLLARVGAGEIVGEMALLDGGARTATARATIPTRCGLLARGDVLPLLASEPDLALALVALIARRVRSGQAAADAPNPPGTGGTAWARLDNPLLLALAGAMVGEAGFGIARATLEGLLRDLREGGEPEHAVRQALEEALLEGARTPARIAAVLLERLDAPWRHR